jgi:precorrin-6B methylase 2
LSPPPDPSQILQIGMGFFASKVLLSAVELGLFTTLAKEPATWQELARSLKLNGRGAQDLLDTLVSLGLLERQGDGDSARYSNSAEAAMFLDRGSPHYMGGILEMANARLYTAWSHLTEALRSGKPQNEIKEADGQELFDVLYADQQRLEGFLAAMAAIQQGNFAVLAETFDFSKYDSMCDVGGASGALAMAVARRHPRVTCISFDLPQVTPVARRAIAAQGLSDRVVLEEGSFFDDPLPKADVITMGNILHDWGLDTKKMLIHKAYEALPQNGAFIAIENVIDDDRRKNTFGLLMSLNMLIETNDGFDYTHAQFESWCREAGFRATELKPLTGPASAAVAYK